MKLLIRWFITAAALFVAAWLIPGIRIEDTSAWIAFGVMAAILALVNAIIRPILAFLSCGCIVATMGLFMFVINAFTLWLSAWIAQNFLGVGFYVDTIWAALFGGIIVSVVSFLLSLVLVDD
ncbi:MAG: phage holin family protein [Anaerolineae bacterium]|jgi:putative membrane protein